MLTLENKFTDFIKLCSENGACADTGDAIPSMEDAVKFDLKEGATCANGFALYRDNAKYPEAWSPWVIEKVGKELDEKCRKYFIDKITNPMMALQILTKCDFLTKSEHILLKAKYTGKLPTAEKEITDSKVILCAAVRVDAKE
jgi:hypothetical protein